MTATWYTADLHFGHAKIAELCDRPYAAAEAMNADLIARFNSVVGPGDTTWILGDFALGRIADTLPLVAELNGTKLLVPGNHDRCHPMHRQAAKWRARYVDAGFADVRPFLTVTEIGGQHVQLCHFPPDGDSRDVDRHTDWRPVAAGWTVHGHVHGRWRQNGQQINVGVDAWGGYPVPEHVVAALVAAGPQTRAPLPWRPAAPVHEQES